MTTLLLVGDCSAACPNDVEPINGIKLLRFAADTTAGDVFVGAAQAGPLARVKCVVGDDAASLLPLLSQLPSKPLSARDHLAFEMIEALTLPAQGAHDREPAAAPVNVDAPPVVEAETSPVVNEALSAPEPAQEAASQTNAAEQRPAELGTPSEASEPSVSDDDVNDDAVRLPGVSSKFRAGAAPPVAAPSPAPVEFDLPPPMPSEMSGESTFDGVSAESTTPSYANESPSGDLPGENLSTSASTFDVANEPAPERGEHDLPSFINQPDDDLGDDGVNVANEADVDEPDAFETPSDAHEFTSVPSSAEPSLSDAALRAVLDEPPVVDGKLTDDEMLDDEPVRYEPVEPATMEPAPDAPQGNADWMPPPIPGERTQQEQSAPPVADEEPSAPPATYRDWVNTASDAEPVTGAASAQAESDTRNPTMGGAPWLSDLKRKRNRDLLQSTVVAVAASKGGVGKSTLTLWLAETLTAAGERVALIDANTGRPDLAKKTGVWEPTGGLSQIVAGETVTSEMLEEVLVPVEGLGRLLPGPPQPMKGTTSADVRAITEAVDALRLDYDWVLMDFPVVTTRDPIAASLLVDEGGIDRLVIVIDATDVRAAVHDTSEWVAELRQSRPRGGFGWPADRSVGLLNRAGAPGAQSLEAIRKWLPDLRIAGAVPYVVSVAEAANEAKWNVPDEAVEPLATFVASTFGVQQGGDGDDDGSSGDRKGKKKRGRFKRR